MILINQIDYKELTVGQIGSIIKWNVFPHEPIRADLNRLKWRINNINQNQNLLLSCIDDDRYNKRYKTCDRKYSHQIFTRSKFSAILMFTILNTVHLLNLLWKKAQNTQAWTWEWARYVHLINPPKHIVVTLPPLFLLFCNMIIIEACCNFQTFKIKAQKCFDEETYSNQQPDSGLLEPRTSAVCQRLPEGENNFSNLMGG